jgi:hypothetical protein
MSNVALAAVSRALKAVKVGDRLIVAEGGAGGPVRQMRVLYVGPSIIRATDPIANEDHNFNRYDGSAKGLTILDVEQAEAKVIRGHHQRASARRYRG